MTLHPTLQHSHGNSSHSDVSLTSVPHDTTDPDASHHPRTNHDTARVIPVAKGNGNECREASQDQLEARHCRMGTGASRIQVESTATRR